MDKIKVAVMGGTGYAAAELIKRLVSHPKVDLLRISSIDHVGENIGKVHRNFANRLNYVLENLSSSEVAKDVDVVFLALPHKVSFTKVPELMDLGVKIIDFSGDYRLRDVALYEKYYKVKHTNAHNISEFIYGLPELNREQIKGSRYIANPGCFPTALALSLLPLAKNGLLNGKVRVVAPTGSSGSGVHPSEATHHPIRSVNLKSYKPLEHQHQPEMEQVLVDAGGNNIAVDFVPMSAPLARGIITNAIVDLPLQVSEQNINDMYRQYYKGEPFVRLLDKGTFPEVIAISGTNYVEIGWHLKAEFNGSKSFVSICSIDNLVKGAAGQAVQNMNLMFNLPETLGLEDFGRWP